MTIAIGAICENNQTIVVASDKMVTYGNPPNLQSETASLKSTELHGSCLAICTGPTSDGEEIIRKAKPQLVSGMAIRDIVERIKIQYGEHREQRVEDVILRPAFGTNYAGFQQSVNASAIANQLLHQIANAVFNFQMPLDILIVGIDAAGPSLWSVNQPGIVNSLNMIGYAALGSGGPYATARLGLGQQAKAMSLAQTIYNVYAAKRAAELGPGVGPLTDMAVMKGTTIKYLPNTFIAHLETLHQKVSALPVADVTSIQQQYDSITQ